MWFMQDRKGHLIRYSGNHWQYFVIDLILKKRYICFFGPFIRGCCYNIDNGLADKFRNKFGDGKYLFDRKDSLFLDLVE